MPEVRAAIDIGTNSVRLVVARVKPRGGFDVLATEKEIVRLGRGSRDMRELSEDAIDRGIAALHRFRQIAEVYGADVTAVATSAVREAENRDVFIRRARAEASIDVEVISGVEEARLIHLGVLQAVPVYDTRHLLVDIGGGSTELLVGLGEEIFFARSVKLGAIRLTDRFFPDGKSDKKRVKACRNFVDAFMAPTGREMAEHSFDVAVGSSGTIAAVAGLVERRRGREPTRWLNSVEFGRADLDDVVAQVLAAPTVAERRAIPGLESRRAEIFVGAVLLLERLFERLGIEKMIVSEYALREGVLADRSRRDETENGHHLSDIRRDSVLRMVDSFHEDRSHVTHTTDLALQLFDELAHIHGYGSAERDLLESAGLLHNVGLFISHAAHHRHSYYVIRHSDQLVGFTEHEVDLIAQIARYHRKSAPKPKRHAEFARLDDADRRRVRLLAGLLRIGIALDRTASEAVEDVRCRLDEALTIEVIVASGADASLELYTANDRSGLLAHALDRPVHVTIGVADDG